MKTIDRQKGTNKEGSVKTEVEKIKTGRGQGH